MCVESKSQSYLSFGRHNARTVLDCRIGLPKPIAACLPLVTAHSCVCSWTRTCCNTTRCGLQRARGTSTSALIRMKLFALAVEWSPTSSAVEDLSSGTSREGTTGLRALRRDLGTEYQRTRKNLPTAPRAPSMRASHS